jgi:hypothetical protein
MIDTLLNFLTVNLTPYGVFKAFYTDGRGVKEDLNVFFNFVFLDAVWEFRGKYPKIKLISDSILKATLKYRPEGDMWRYWIKEDIYPDFGDIALGSLVLKKYGLNVSPQVFDTISKYRTRSCVFLFKAPYDYENKRCDCIVNINVFRFTRDTTLCPYIRKCWEKIGSLASYTYEYAPYFFYYFYSKALREGLSCGFDIKDRVMRELKNDTLSGLPLILTFASASILGIRGEDMENAYRRIKGSLLEDGGPREEVYFYIFGARGPTKYRFFGRTFPAIILLDGVLNYAEGDN